LTKTSDLGQLGEELACNYLKRRGYRIIAQNYWKPFGELDIIAKALNGRLVFVEVKTVSGKYPLVSAEEQLTEAKLNKLEKISSYYANGPGKQLLSKGGWRIDLIAITKEEKLAMIKHYKNINGNY